MLEKSRPSEAVQKIQFLSRLIFICFCSTFLLTCDFSIAEAVRGGQTELVLESGYERRVDFGSAVSASVTLKNLFRNTVYLVKANRAGVLIPDHGTYVLSQSNSIAAERSVVESAETATSNEAAAPLTKVAEAVNNGYRAYRHYKPAQEWNENPPPIDFSAPDWGAGGGPLRSMSAPSFALKDTLPGADWNFWVELDSGWNSINAKLTAIGEHCKVWVYDNCITQEAAANFAAKFDKVYVYETNILGYEYGGGPGGNGGVDGDERIQILVYDIIGVGTAGFFWSKDYYPQTQLDLMSGGIKTNNAEIFYIDSNQSTNSPDFIVSTLVHEFQHMIQFNQKFLKSGITASTWYNEMMSMMAEDMISPMPGIDINAANPGHPIQLRIPGFRTYPWSSGVTEWLEDEIDPYPTAFAFGAYLARNFGGPLLLREMELNGKIDVNSITDAMTACGYPEGFNGAISKFAEAFIYQRPPPGYASYSKTASAEFGDYTYSFDGFDLTFSIPAKNTLPLRPTGVLIEEIAQNFSGDLQLSLTSPRDEFNRITPYIDVFFLIK